MLRVNVKYVDGCEYSVYESKKAIAFDDKFGNIGYKDKVILDIGCGFGGSLLHYLNKGARFCYGIDYDSHRTTTSMKYLTDNDTNPKKCFIINADARELPVKDMSADIVINDAAFEHIVNLEKVISELYRVMKPGGKVYFSCGSTWLTYNGGHLWKYIPIPWIHLLFSKKTMIATLKLFYRFNDSNYPVVRIKNIINLYETLGCLTIRSLRNIIKKSNFHNYSIFQYSSRPWKKCIDKIPLLNDLHAGSVCCVLEKSIIR